MRKLARGARIRSLEVCAATAVLAAVAAVVSGGGPAARAATLAQASGPLAAAPCSRATAARLGKPYLWDPFRSQQRQIAQLLCGPFAGPGSTAMVMSFRAPTCWGEQGWAMFRLVGGKWRLVKVQRGTFLFPFIVVDNDIQENSPAFRRGDPRCLPSLGRQGRVWHWNGTRLVPSAAGWMLLTTDKPGGSGGDLYSPLPGRIYCTMKNGDEDEYYVRCESETLAQTVTLTLAGQVTICASGCALAPAPWNMRPARVPFGQGITLDDFRCLSQPTGVLCTVIASGKGFLINSTGISRVG